MNRNLIAAAMLAAGVFVTPVSAQVMIDMGQVTCKDLAGYDADTSQFITSWMSGYFSASKNLNVLQFDYLKRNKAKVAQFCKKHKNATLFGVVQKVAH
jgi:acid stress chaperone HdeB